MSKMNSDNIRVAVQKQYGKIAQSANGSCGCSVQPCCGELSSNSDQASIALGYSQKDIKDAPSGANMGLGCGNPRVIAKLKVGETVLDLGSGGGFDCFLAAKEVGESGHVIGIDMTSEMINKARENIKKTGFENVEFRLGEIEHLPVADKVADVIISNCVINLSPEKKKVFGEAFRVLKEGGRLAISDIVLMEELPEKLKSDMALYTGCISGASFIDDIKEMLEDVGFIQISIQPKEDSKGFIKEWFPKGNIEDYIISATIEAVKPF